MNYPELGRALGAAFRRHGLSVAGLQRELTPAVTAAWHRGHPGAVLAALDARPDPADAFSQMVRAFLLRRPTPRAEIDALVGSGTLTMLLDAHLASAHPDGTVTLLIDVRPHRLAGEDVIVISDADASMTKRIPGPDHVLGVGAASLSLLEATPTTPVETLLDLGIGSGVQILGQAQAAAHITATDVHPRALDLAAATCAANEAVLKAEVELLPGPWFEPVGKRRFERIVANPPFVVGAGKVRHVYRDSTLNVDGASQLVVSQAAEHLTPGGTAYLLASWVHPRDSSWRQRVASWIPERGVDAWVIQRDMADPELYVGTWLEDESIDPRSAEGIERTIEWLKHFAAEGVQGVGFGVVALRNIGDLPSQVNVEEVAQPFSDPLGPEIEEYFLRSAWLREHNSAEIAQASFCLRPGVAVERISTTDTETGMGFSPAALRLTRTDGPRFSHEVDEALVSILSGLNPEGLSLEDVVELYAYAQSLDAAEDLLQQCIVAIIDLVRHGFVLPSELVLEPETHQV